MIFKLYSLIVLVMLFAFTVLAEEKVSSQNSLSQGLSRFVQKFKPTGSCIDITDRNTCSSTGYCSYSSITHKCYYRW